MKKTMTWYYYHREDMSNKWYSHTLTTKKIKRYFELIAIMRTKDRKQ